MTDDDRCRPVELPDGEVIRLRGDVEPDAATVAMLAEVVAAVRAMPVDPAMVERQRLARERNRARWERIRHGGPAS